MEIPGPYLLFLGDAPDQLAAKVAAGIRDWRPDRTVGQFRLESCNADMGLDDISLAEAKDRGAKTMVVGVANRGGVISDAWIKVLREALEQGMNLAAGLHNRLADIEELVEAARASNCSLFDVRHPREKFPVGNGRRRSGRRLLTVGTDCSCGKMYTSLAIDREMSRRGMDSDFRATGQTGILIAGSGVSVDAVIADFISGAVEAISPDADPSHWDVIEGQGSLFHASYAGVTTGLIHGSQPDALVLCHEPTRTHMRGLPEFPVPDIETCMRACLATARLTNPDVETIGIAANTSALGDRAAREYLEATQSRFGLPAVDPVRTGVGPIIDNLS